MKRPVLRCACRSAPHAGDHPQPTAGRTAAHGPERLRVPRFGRGQARRQGAEPSPAPSRVRHAAGDWAGEEMDHDTDICEAVLSHKLKGGRTREAHERGDLLEKRRKLIYEWSDVCSGVRPAVRPVYMAPRRRGPRGPSPPFIQSGVAARSPVRGPDRESGRLSPRQPGRSRSSDLL